MNDTDANIKVEEDLKQVNDWFNFHRREQKMAFERIENKTTLRPDLHAFNLLGKLFPVTDGSYINLISDAECEVVYLSFSSEQISTLSEENVIELLRCGIDYCGCCLCFWT